jgi:hypothetical protein
MKSVANPSAQAAASLKIRNPQPKQYANPQKCWTQKIMRQPCPHERVENKSGPRDLSRVHDPDNERHPVTVEGDNRRSRVHDRCVKNQPPAHLCGRGEEERRAAPAFGTVDEAPQAVDRLWAQDSVLAMRKKKRFLIEL